MASSKAHHFDKLLYEQSIYSKAFSHPARIMLLTHLNEYGTTPYSELCREIPLAKVTISQHISFLREDNLVHMEEIYPHSYYTLDYRRCQELAYKTLPLYQRFIRNL